MHSPHKHHIISIHKKITYALHSCSEHKGNMAQCSYFPLYDRFLEKQHFGKDQRRWRQGKETRGQPSLKNSYVLTFKCGSLSKLTSGDSKEQPHKYTTIWLRATQADLPKRGTIVIHIKRPLDIHMSGTFLRVTELI